MPSDPLPKMFCTAQAVSAATPDTQLLNDNSSAIALVVQNLITQVVQTVSDTALTIETAQREIIAAVNDVIASSSSALDDAEDWLKLQLDVAIVQLREDEVLLPKAPTPDGVTERPPPVFIPEDEPDVVPLPPMPLPAPVEKPPANAPAPIVGGAPAPLPVNEPPAPPAVGVPAAPGAIAQACDALIGAALGVPGQVALGIGGGSWKFGLLGFPVPLDLQGQAAGFLGAFGGAFLQGGSMAELAARITRLPGGTGN